MAEYHHKPAAERQIGLAALKFYAFGLIGALIWFFLLTPEFIKEISSPHWIYEPYAAEIWRSDFWIDERTAIRSLLLVGIYLSLTIYFFMGGEKLSVFARLRYFPKRFYLAGIACFTLYLVTFYLRPEEPFSSLWLASWSFGAPLGMLMLPMISLTVKEYLKEHPFYRRLFILGHGAEAARWGGIYSYFQRDVGEWFAHSKRGIKRTKTSPIYVGKTLFEKDTRIGGRHLGLVSEQHLITVASTGAGKSRDAITTNLLTYSGGIVGFDPKGEHTRVTMRRRAAYAPFNVIDPYGVVSDVVNSSHWNPLEEINPAGSSARGDLERVASASIFMDKNETGNSSHFRENAQKILRGFIAHVVTRYPEDQRHLGTVYDLIKTGHADGEKYDPKAMTSLLVQMSLNPEIAGAPRDAAALLNSVSDRERGSYLSTIARGIDWINEPTIRKIISKKSDFSVKDCKRKDATVYLVLPEKYIEQMSRFLRTFYTVAFDSLDSHETPQPVRSERRVLFLFDEFNTLGTFAPAESAAVYKRSSYIKCWFIVQNMEQLFTHYTNATNFLSSCDKQFFGLDATDTRAKEVLEAALGGYVEKNMEGMEGETRYSELQRKLMPHSELAEFLDAGAANQIVLPVKGSPLKLKRVPYYNLIPKGEYGHFERQSK